MSIFRSIMSKIFGGRDAAASPGSPQGGSAPGAVPVPTAPAPPGASATPTPVAPQAATPVDVEAVLVDLATHNPQKLDWRRSIVDLMKLLDLDSSLRTRQELANELGYNGNMDDSAAMNIWLHSQVMTKLAENGGKIPDALRS